MVYLCCITAQPQQNTYVLSLCHHIVLDVSNPVPLAISPCETYIAIKKQGSLNN